MHKPFYASGFLYHPTTRQILLQYLDSNNEATFVLFRGKSHKTEDPLKVFKRCVESVCGVSIPASAIRPVYDYIQDALEQHYIFYVEVTDNTLTEYSSNKKTEWLSLSRLSKYMMSDQTRHDLVIGERVIRSHMTYSSPEESSKSAPNKSV